MIKIILKPFGSSLTSPLFSKFCQLGVLGFRDSGSLSRTVAKLRNNYFADCNVVSSSVFSPAVSVIGLIFTLS